MRHLWKLTAASAAIMALPQQALAQQDDGETMRAELQLLRSQVAEMQKRLDAVEQKDGDAAINQPLQPSPATSAATAATATTSAPTTAISAPEPAAAKAATPPETQIKWGGGAPELSNSDGWSFKPRGRMQFDVAGVSLPDGVAPGQGGMGSEFRRLFLGAEGEIPGGFEYLVEVGLQNGVSLIDAWLRYTDGPVSITAGHMRPYWGLEELTSSLSTTLLERSSISQAFNFGYRAGVGVAYRKGDVILQGGVFGANADALTSHSDRSVSQDFRVVWAPKLDEKTTLHLGGSAHFRQLNNDFGTVRYSPRPGNHSTDVRLVDTGSIRARGERGLGLEAALSRGRFHATGETYWQNVRRVDGLNPNFFGGYAEVGLVLTEGDRRGYGNGVFGRLIPSRTVAQGGIGAVQLNLRFDHVNLNDKDIMGGRQNGAWASLVWAPMQRIRITANYGKLWIYDSPLQADNGSTNYRADSYGLRTQFDF